jgi:hypothetical protein
LLAPGLFTVFGFISQFRKGQFAKVKEKSSALKMI